MTTRIDYGQLAAKLDYTALDKKLEQLGQREPPRKRKTAVDALEPLRDRLLALHNKGWSSSQLVEELKAAGVPVSPARMRDCLNRWNGHANGVAKTRARRRPQSTNANDKLPTAPPPVGRAKGAPGDGQPGFKFTGH
ncbi:MAG TPA: hypothetical protein VH619_14300 [Verrucomicrobiae bacterium]|jgi:hypothetical protein|nr:hypothetical protein [Verrucomicrobiae bacterium]